jgi:S-formylglutathione hydrolase FrmB
VGYSMGGYGALATAGAVYSRAVLPAVAVPPAR